MSRWVKRRKTAAGTISLPLWKFWTHLTLSDFYEFSPQKIGMLTLSSNLKMDGWGPVWPVGTTWSVSACPSWHSLWQRSVCWAVGLFLNVFPKTGVAKRGIFFLGWSGILDGSKLITMTYRRYLKRWIFPYTFNTIGVFLQAGFASVCAIALQPMMCYSHPNGFRSFLPWHVWVDWVLDDVVLGMNLLPRLRVIWYSLCFAEKIHQSWTTRLASQRKPGLSIWYIYVNIQFGCSVKPHHMFCYQYGEMQISGSILRFLGALKVINNPLLNPNFYFGVALVEGHEDSHETGRSGRWSLIAKAMTIIRVFLRRGPSSLIDVFLMCRFVAFSEVGFVILFLFGLIIDLPSLKLTQSLKTNSWMFNFLLWPDVFSGAKLLLGT